MPTVAGLLTVGRDPVSVLTCAAVQFNVYESTTLTGEVRDQRLLTGPMPEMLRELDLLLRMHNRFPLDYVSADRGATRSPFPPAAVEQVRANMVLHRTYEDTNTPSRVYCFSDRIEFHSPGGPYGSVTVENFGRPYATDYRNPNLAAAMKNLEFVQRFGSGIELTRRAMAENGNPEPEFVVTPGHVLVTLRKRP